MRKVLEFARLTPEPGPDADAVWHEFVATFELTPAQAGGVVGLELEGVAGDFELHLGERLLIVGDFMFGQYGVDLTGVVVAGANTLRIAVRPLTESLDSLPRKPRARWRTQLTDEPRLRWIRTSVLGRAPGFAPGPPVVGPYRPVTLTVGPQLQAHAVARVEGDTGILEVPRAGVDLDVEVSLRGRPVLSTRLPDGGRIEIADVERWWPHTHGEPVRYEVRLAREGADPVTRWVGFRTVANHSSDSVDLLVNGVRVFCRGAVWTPGDLAALDEAVALGLNLVRVPGVAAYESDAFHDRCDELGLLVWQDLMFATFDYPLADPDFAREVEFEVRGHAARLREHPSTAVVCGSAEHEQQAAMFGVRADTGYARELAAFTRPLVEASGLDAVWVDGTPCGGDPVTRVDTGVAQYFGVGAYLRDLPDVRHSRVRFAGECLAFSNLTDPAVSGVVEGGVPRDNGADWDFADVREHYLRRRYGEHVSADGPEARRVTGEVMADVFGEWRRPDSGCGGGIVLWLRDLVPGAGWGLLDHRGRPKPAALALAPTLQPTTVWVVDEGLSGLDVHVAHDGPASESLSLLVEVLREDGSVLESAEVAWEMEPHGHRTYGVEALLGRFADITYAYRFGDQQQAAVRARLTGGFGQRGATWRVPRQART